MTLQSEVSTLRTAAGSYVDLMGIVAPSLSEPAPACPLIFLQDREYVFDGADDYHQN